MVRIRMGSGKRGSRGSTGTLGKLGGTFFFGIFFLMGAAFCVFVLMEAVRTVDSYGWPEHAATIVDSGIPRPTGDADYQLEVTYRYSVNGRELTSSQVSTQDVSDSAYADLARRLERYAPGTQTVCYVNPDDPYDAVLEHASAWFGLVILVPLVFVVIGGGGLWFVWFGKPKDPLKKSKLSAAKSGGGVLAGWIVLGVIAVVGAATTWFFTVGTWTEYAAAQGWDETPAVVEFSRVRSHDSDDGTTYSVDILYRYERDGRTYRSNRYSFVGGSSSGYDGKREIVSDYPAGKRTVCYVDPDDPHRTVLMRGFSWMMLLTLLPVPFLFIGIGGLWYMARQAPSRRRRGVIGERGDPAAASAGLHERPDWLPAMRYEPGPVALRPATGRIGRFVGIVFVAAFWNGITSIFVTIVVKSHLKGDPEWFMTIFIIPFVLVGLALIGAVFWELLRLFNARVALTVSEASAPLGETVDVSWDLIGRVKSVQRLSITLEGREEATYRRGTDTITDKETFRTIEIADTTHTHEIDTGRARLTIPDDTMHTFIASNNKVKWMLKVHGDIRLWPDIDQEYELVVLPHRSRGVLG